MHFPLFILPFDHRNGLAKILGNTYPFEGAELEKVQDLKRLVFEAILEVRKDYTGPGMLGSLFDEETAGDVIPEALKLDLPLILSLEKSGTKTLELIYGDQTEQKLKDVRPTYGKLLVHYQAGHDEAHTQRKIMKQVSDVCETQGVPLMLEILLDKPEGHTPADILAVFKEIHADQIKVGIWKIEGFDAADDWKALALAARAPMIILGRGQNREAVEAWVKAAAQSTVVSGFAIGRTIFEEPVVAYAKGQITRAEALQAIADNYQHFIKLWETYV